MASISSLSIIFIETAPVDNILVNESGGGITSRPTSRPTSKPSKYNPPKKNGWVKKAVIGAGAAYVGYKVVIIIVEQSLHYILKYAGC